MPLPNTSIRRLSLLSSIADMKRDYLNGLVAPMDGMWEVGFTDPSPHYEILINGESAGYYAANAEGILLQFHVRRAFEQFGRLLFDHVITQASLNGAEVSTIDPFCLSCCLDVQQKVTVHTFLYELRSTIEPSQPVDRKLEFRPIDGAELERTITFQQHCLGGEQDLSGWLRGYSANLIEREELYVLCEADRWMGIGEGRKSDSQKGVIDLGMMVDPDLRGKGVGTYILSLLAHQARDQALRPICSTTVDNPAARKAIQRAGFISRHRILSVAF